MDSFLFKLQVSLQLLLKSDHITAFFQNQKNKTSE